ncbi:ferrichrome/ferrioxamine B periplasmic transporter [uncultured Roseburia sp.]|nr:ferrichrome/ferrioxamine B periplasmic transporter [uncultured Roseburia sp.]
MGGIKKGWKKTAGVLLAAALLISTLGGCAGGSDINNNKETAKTRIFTDSLGREVEVPEEITSVVSSGNLAQIMLFAAAPDSLMGISGSWSDDAEEYIDRKYLELPDVGALFVGHDLNYEEITKLNPQIIIDVGEVKDSLKEDLDEITDKTGIPAVHISVSIESMGDAFRTLGDLLNQEEQGEKLAEYCEEAYQLTEDTMKIVTENGEKKSLLYCTGENGLNVIAKNSYQSQIIDLVSDNLAVLKNPSAKGTGNEVDMEMLMNWDPEIIIFAPDGYYEYVKEDTVWHSLKAVNADTYYEVPNGPYNWMGSPPSSNRVLGMLWMTKLLYPKEADFDLKEKVKEYYKLFYHCELTDEQYQHLTERSILKSE